MVLFWTVALYLCNANGNYLLHLVVTEVRPQKGSEESRSLLRGKWWFPPRKVRVSSEESETRGQVPVSLTPNWLVKQDPVPSSHSRVPQTLVNNVDFVRQEGSPFLCGEGREIGNFEHQGPHFEPRRARLDVREILLRELHSAETLRCWIGLWHESFENLRLNLRGTRGQVPVSLTPD